MRAFLGSVARMSGFQPGLEGVIAFETEIAEPDREGSALRYRGVDVEDLVGRHPFEQVWGLLVDGSLEPGMPQAERLELQDASGSVMADLQAGLATLGPKLGLRQLVDISPEEARDDLARLSAAALSLVAQAARGDETPVPEHEVDAGENAAAQFLIRWHGEADQRHVTALDTYWVSAAEHGINASTFTARIAASTGADCAAAMSAAVGALSGPLHGGAPTRVLRMLDEVEASGDADEYVRALLGRGERIMGFGHRVYRAEDPRARVLRRTAQELGSSRVEVAETLEQAALAALRERSPDRALATNVEFWAAVVLELAEVPPPMYPAMFACARTAGWSAHILEQRRTGRLIRPSARYVGEPAAKLPVREADQGKGSGETGRFPQHPAVA
jgi:citrate synthase